MGNQSRCLNVNNRTTTKSLADVIAFIEQTCFIPEGKFVGKKLELFEWQKDEIRRIYDNKHGTRRAIIRARTRRPTFAAGCCLRTFVALQRATNQTVSFTPRRKAATRPASFSRWQRPPRPESGAAGDDQVDFRTQQAAERDPASAAWRRPLRAANIDTTARFRGSQTTLTTPLRNSNDNASRIISDSTAATTANGDEL